MREQAGLAVIQKRAEIHAGVPIGREIIDSAFRQDSLKSEALRNYDAVHGYLSFAVISGQLNTMTAIRDTKMSGGQTRAYKSRACAYAHQTYTCTYINNYYNRRYASAIGASELFRNGNTFSRNAIYVDPVGKDRGELR